MPRILKIWMLVSCMTIFSVNASEMDKVFSLIDQRLSYMKEVAADKAIKHLAVEDLRQEQKVLQKAMRTAEANHLDADSVKPLFTALMETAKVIQYRYRADWLTTPQIDWQPRKLEEIRADIALSSDLLIKELRRRLSANIGFDQVSRDRLMQIVDEPKLSDADKERIFTALQTVKLKAAKLT
ncbi:chorismate mutase [Candidatus Fukatsuia symbiotica]|uniref:chorismate mutase n=1 Tax=Candidatus Fukatsuia symbiotica TaxID=1878942 RepID=A0A2U8I732_9GAMM|nr:chorismate mutase [Candidatus Fukatsuia symbiotica]AWK14972.1 hypothetical protein CCS41_11630 [Candidatus Fukatsuia symbiotica]MEA9443763.1 chorismate mutase [Candidatus Fukatsuia symbiotica]